MFNDLWDGRKNTFIDKKLFEKLFFIDDKYKIKSGFGKYFQEVFTPKLLYMMLLKKKRFKFQFMIGFPKKNKEFGRSSNETRFSL